MAEHSVGDVVVTETKLPLPMVARGKVRDIYDLGDRLLMVATDRISAFDVVLPVGIPDKGRILTGLSLFWFEFTRGLCPNHVLGGDEYLPAELSAYRDLLSGRCIVVKKARVFPVECVVRGYLAGAAWQEYEIAQLDASDGVVRLWDVELPAELRESDKLPEPVFTPTTKASQGHDANISFEEMCKLVGSEIARRLRELSISIYQYATEYALRRGFIIADTKFEFGEVDGEIMVVDEMLTPDSSRFWDAETYQPGRPQPAFDKQIVRDYLQGLVERGEWNKEYPGPVLPPEIVRETRARYLAAYERLTGRTLG
ncbi:MAG: phosphoribosylaminoimidazolesuccinocarboxamide synthase [Armatimonadota bacterium]